MTRKQRQQHHEKVFNHRLWDCIEVGLIAGMTGSKPDQRKYEELSEDIEERLIKNRKHRRDIHVLH